MASVPYEASEIERFTPASLAHLETPPVFRLRAATRRERRRYDRLMVEEGLRRHDKDAMRDEIIRGLRALSSDDEFERWEMLLRAHWEAADEFENEHRDLAPEKIPAFVPPGPSEDEIARVTRGVHENWGPLRKMAADNLIFNREAPALLISVILSGWSGLCTPFRSHEGTIPLDTIDALDKDLAKLEQDNDLSPGKAFVDLYVAATNRMFLSGDAEKNSSSPAPSPSDQQTTSHGAESPAGTSKASATSPETPAS
ncbi:hypothetical protein SAMIE_1015500 [Sphingobium amiense]|uniref:Uncharacterized protein n=1 Tax=Sphingobium amiense TaxID=135719 RepID=A0A494WCM5_9SPHN|nr:hypothetical protein [Sphingobium amiense]BBD98049.1 hypothetical protein SAMIE_1015500 [Sphingobium amiense]